MIFHFTGQVLPETLLKEIEPLVRVLLDAGVKRISSMHISANCFTENAECQIINDVELVSQMYFDETGSENISGALRKLREDGSILTKRPDDMPYGG